jgi:hypothetical protein
MLSITHQLARRLESAEAEVGVACVKAQVQLDPSACATYEPLMGGYLVFVGSGSPLTHALGLGFDGTVTESDVERMEEFYHSRGSGVTVDVCPYADASFLEILTKHGYRISEFTTVLVRQTAEGPRASDVVDGPAPRLAAPSEAELYAETVVRGFFGRDG